MHGGVLLVGGTGRYSGQGAVSLGIAQGLALEGQRVAVIDLDVATPTVARVPRLRTRSLEAVLAHPASLEDEWTELDAVDLTPARGESNGAGIFVVAAPAPQSPSLDEIPPAALRALVSIATDLVDTVIVSLASLDDGLGIAETAGRALVVARRNETTKGAAATARRALMVSGVPGLGVVVTAPSRIHRLGRLSIPAGWRPGFLAARPESAV
jgi:Mrp family chromosome partitioning ATPase